jgi:hypothetical protein
LSERARPVKQQDVREPCASVRVLRRPPPSWQASARKERTIVSPPQVEHHRWLSPAPPRRGLVPLDADTRALLRAWRNRPPPREPWRVRLAFGVVLAGHVLLAILASSQMQPRPGRDDARARPDEALQVRFIERPRETTAPAMSPLPAREVAPPRRERSATDAPVASPLAPDTAPMQVAPRLRDHDGQPLLPAEPASATAKPGYIQRLPQGDAQVMRHDSPVQYKATRLEAFFPPPNETLLHEGVRHALDKTRTGNKKPVNLGRGVHLQCKTLFGIPTPICTMPPAPPSKKDGDARLNMAPAAPLAKELTPPGRDLATCIARYRAGEPLPYGCPVDTVKRAVDAECGEARQAGKPLPAHCRKS